MEQKINEKYIKLNYLNKNTDFKTIQNHIILVDACKKIIKNENKHLLVKLRFIVRGL